ncbi:flagellin [Aidingimonas halophila]|uniref:Flagellin n=1 Tax=Aidingimonas halophila TaxID=574349 RepID=A0A1H3D748_9GAMM|nr:flagellin [Aidingimonas halophila]GHC30427.1 flagellin [Aidingimonas halophila]SDX62205.1 Flagellin FlgL [Aidingimonas halophila]
MNAIHTNLAALTSQQHQRQALSEGRTAMERLASGMRVNGAQDDAAGLAIGNRMTSQVNGHAQAQHNANDGISLLQTAEGALSQVNDRLQRVRELTVQGLNGTLNLDDSDAIQAEINANLKEIDRIAESAEFNGIPLLDGKAGDIDLQTGTNDGEQLGVDMSGPGFSVESLGLEDFTVAGLEGDVSRRDQLIGRALDIHVDAPNTTMDFDVPTSNTPTLRNMAQGSGDGPYGYYVSAEEGGEPVFYDASVTATHETATDQSTVNISTERLYRTVDEIPESTGGTSTELLDSNGNTISGDLVQSDDGRYLIASTDGEGETRYLEAELRFEAGSGSLTAQAIDDQPMIAGGVSPVNTLAGADVTDPDVSVSYYHSDNSHLSPSGQGVVEADGFQYIESGSTPAYYRVDESRTGAITHGDGTTTVNVHADDDIPLRDGNIASTTDIDRTPRLDLPDDTSEIDFRDSDDNALASGDVRLMQREDDDHYMIEVDEGGGVYSYYEAQVDVVRDADDTSFTVSAQNDDATTFDPTQHEVETVNGTSTVTIDPRNVEVNYTDSHGDDHQDVLRQGGDGNYYFDLPDSSSDYGNYKVANLVDTEDNDILIKTINGNNEVIIYHPADLNTTYNVNVRTDANGFDNDDSVSDGTPHTVIDITEDAREIRLKQPKNPLTALDQAIGMVDSKRSHLGALENRLNSVAESSETAETQLSSARSRIMDADYAAETANLTKSQILQQAGNSMLAQANQLPQNALSLLG